MFNRGLTPFLGLVKEAEKHMPSSNKMTVRMKMWILEDAFRQGGNA
jgi:hypothetical protein